MKNLGVIFAFVVFVFGGCLAVCAQTVTDTGKAVPASTPPSETLIASATAKNDRYRIGFQDILDIQVYRHADLSQRVPVSPNGTIVLFRIEKPIVATCKTERELATEIENAYRDIHIRNPLVRVVVAEQKSQAVALIGAVERPGNYYVNRRVHLLEILAMAGGPSKEAGTRLLIARTGSTSNCRESGDPADSDQIAVVDFKLRDVQEGKQTFWMQPGDVVSVLDADVVYVYGNVNKQGSYRVREPITLTQAIVSAEGLRPAANKDKVRILRQKAGSLDREEFVFDLNLIDKGKVKDPFLEPNDIVAVSEDRAKAVVLGVMNLIKGSVPSAIYRLP